MTLISAGFSHVTKDFAFASDRPLVLQTTQMMLRREFRDYPAQRAIHFNPVGDMFLAPAGRVFQQTTNNVVLDQARRILTLVEDSWASRFGHGLEMLGKLAAGKTSFAKPVSELP